MIQNAIVRLSKYVVLFALLSYIAILFTSKWHDIRVYPQKLGCTKGKDAIVVKKNILWSIVYKKIEITKTNSHYKSLMVKIKEILISEKYTRQRKEFGYYGKASRINFCFKNGAYKDFLNEQRRYPIRRITVVFKDAQALYKEGILYILWGPNSPKHRAKYSKEKIEQFFDDVNKATEEQKQIDSKR